MVVVEVLPWHKCDEELRILGVRTHVCHGNDALGIVLVWKRHVFLPIVIDLLDILFVLESLCTVDAMTSAAVVIHSVTALHELVLEDPVEGAVLIVELFGLIKFRVSTFLAGAVRSKVLNSVRLVIPEVDLKCADDRSRSIPFVVVVLRRYLEEDPVLDLSFLMGLLQGFLGLFSP